LDIRKQTFRKTMRGFDPEDVRVFLDMIADEYEQLLQENGMLSEKVRHLNEQIERYHGMERTLQNSLLTAERVSEEARERSRIEAENVVEEARQRGERILEDSRERLQLLGRQIQELQGEKERFTQQLLAFLEGQIQVLRDHEEELEEIGALEGRAAEYLAQSSRPLSEDGAAESEESVEAQAGADPESGAPEDGTVAGAPVLADAPPAAPRMRAGEGIRATSSAAAQKVEQESRDGFFARAESRPAFFDRDADGGVRG
jgi:cell division initiation protein